MPLAATALRGMYRDVVVRGGAVLVDSGWNDNTIVDRCHVLLAGFIKNEPSSGIQYLAVGQGSTTWDNTGPPAIDPDTTNQLVSGYKPPIAVTELHLVYLDQNDHEVGGPTSRLQITATLPPGYPAPLAPLSTYPLREFGLFGRFGANDLMINCIRHPVIHKDAAATLIRMLRLYF